MLKRLIKSAQGPGATGAHNPAEVAALREPEAILAEIAALDAESAGILAEIRALL